MSNSIYKVQKTIMMTLDPVHIGTGGYRLGRVDNSIVREPGFNVPKIPGTSLSGACRSYAAMKCNKRECAGQGKPDSGHCEKGHKECPICYTFGSATKADSGYSGTVNISDARILFFPVHSMIGPVWVTTKDRLEEALEIDFSNFTIGEDKLKCSFKPPSGKLNLGWLMLEAEEINFNSLANNENGKKIADTVTHRLVIANDKIFSQVVNSNLEVRTSVSINPETGAAKVGALFTYEAIPRATWLWCDIVEDDYMKKIPETSSPFNKNKDVNQKECQKTCDGPLNVLNCGMSLIEYLGVGGMGTRGFGRMKIMGKKVIKDGQS